jgi:hypothetical protein
MIYLNLSRDGRYDEYLTIPKIIASDWSKSIVYYFNIGEFQIQDCIKSLFDYRRFIREGTLDKVPYHDPISSELLDKGMLGNCSSDFLKSDLGYEVESALTEIQDSKLNLIESLILLFNSVNVEVAYINFDSDSIKIDPDSKYCTLKMTRYFRSLLTRITRSEYLKLRVTDNRLAIRSGNKFYKHI